MTVLHLSPPLGPLSWLFPELSCLQVPGQDERALADAAAAARRLGRDPGTVVRVPPGPLGHALAAALRPLAADPWRQVPSVDAHPAAESLEGCLRAASARFPQQAVAVRATGGLLAATAAPLTLDHAHARRLQQARTAAWVLPIEPSAAGAAQLDAALALITDDPTPFAAAGLVPVLLTGTAARCAAAPRTRAAPSWWGVFAGDEAPSALGARHRALVALLYPERVLTLDGYDSLALSGCDLYAAALRAALSPPRPTPRPARAAIVGICGIDGSGKSTHVRALAAHLAERGRRVKVHKIYRHGVFHDTVTDVVRQTAGGRNLHLWRIERIAKAFDSVKYYFAAVEHDLACHDVVLFDRYVHTHFAAGAGRCHWDPFTRELLGVFPPADLMFLLDVPVATALARIGQRSERTLDENAYMLGRYREMLLRLARRDMTVLDGGAPFSANHAAICARVDAWLAARQPATRTPLASTVTLGSARHAGDRYRQAPDAPRAPRSASAGTCLPAPDPAPGAADGRAQGCGTLVVLYLNAGAASAPARALLPADGEFARAWRGLRAHGAALPFDVVLHGYAYELLERLREHAAASSTTVHAPLWPEAMFAAGDIAPNAAPELAAVGPPLQVRWRRPQTADVAAAAQQLFGALPFDPVRYVDALVACAERAGWTPA